MRLKKVFANIHTTPDEKVSLTDSVPIYPDLIDCTDDINNLLNIITFKDPQTFAKKIVKDFKTRNILTIGDLAKMPSLDVVRLPLIYPKLTTVVNAFKLYSEEKQISKTDETNSESAQTVDLIEGVKLLDVEVSTAKASDDKNENEENDVREVLQTIKSYVSSYTLLLLIKIRTKNVV